LTAAESDLVSAIFLLLLRSSYDDICNAAGGGCLLDIFLICAFCSVKVEFCLHFSCELEVDYHSVVLPKEEIK